MKILYLSSDSGIPVLGRKGASVHVRSLVTAFGHEGHAVVVVTPSLTKSPWETPASFDAEIVHMPASDTIVSAIDTIRSYNEALGIENSVPSEIRRILYTQQLEAKLTRRFEHARPDFIYERAALFSTAGVSVARALDVPLVVELNAPLSLEQSTYRGSYLPAVATHAERRTLREADLVLTVSSPLRQYAIEQGVAADRAVVMPNGIEPDLFRPGAPSVAARERWQVGPGPVLGFVGGLRPWHGVRALPELLARLAPRHPSLRLVIAGDGPLRDELTAAFRQRQVAERVVFTGAVAHEDVADLVRLFDVALAPYNETEHLFYYSPLKLFEYMGCGVPVIAAGLGQILDVVDHDTNGLLYAPGDLDALTAACARLLDDPPLRRRLGSSAAETVHAKYTWRHNAKHVIELVQEIAARQETSA